MSHRNWFPGQCYFCGKWVKVGEGHFERLGKRRRPGQRKFTVIHAECVFRQRALKEMERKEAR